MIYAYRCLKCSHSFIYMKGDLVHDPSRPHCPACGSMLVVRIPKIARQ